VPPIAPESVRTTGVFGVGFMVAAAVLGLIVLAIGEVPTALNTARLFLVLFGAVAVGAAISLRPDLWWAWAVGAGAAALGWGGLPGPWDSFRLLFEVLFAVTLIGVVMCLLPPCWRLGGISAIVLFHFSGIFMATTSPPTDPLPAPWITIQAFSRVYQPYLQFI